MLISSLVDSKQARRKSVRYLTVVVYGMPIGPESKRSQIVASSNGATISVKQLSRYIAIIDNITDLIVNKKWVARLNDVKAGELENLRTSNFQFDYEQTGFSNHCFTPQMKGSTHCKDHLLHI